MKPINSSSLNYNKQFEFTDYFRYLNYPKPPIFESPLEIEKSRTRTISLRFLQYDRNWGFVQWEIPSSYLKKFRVIIEPKEIFLRIFSYTKNTENMLKCEETRDVFLDSKQGRQYVQFLKKNEICWHQVGLYIQKPTKILNLVNSQFLLTSVECNIQIGD